jgi:putative endopeptidase
MPSKDEPARPRLTPPPIPTILLSSKKTPGVLVKRIAFLSCLLGGLVLILASGAPAQSPAARNTKPATQAPAGAKNGLDLSSLDRSAKACLNFYQFANGGWMAKNPIPPAYPIWAQFTILQNHNDEILREILEQAARPAAAGSAPGSVEQKLGDFYASCMETKQIDAEGLAPLAPELARIHRIENPAALQAEIARLQSFGVNALFEFSSAQDYKNSSQEIGDAAQGGLGLPDRDYYLRTDAKSKELLASYTTHVQRMLELAGDSPAQAASEAKTVLAIETKLATASMTQVEQRDPDATYHKMDAAALQSLTPNFSWKAYLSEVGFPGIDSVNVEQPKFFEALSRDLAGTPLADWRTYLRWHLIHAAAPALSAPFVEENFHFYGQVLTGAKEILPRWKRCVQATNHALGMALGEKYVARTFPPAAKQRAVAMVDNILGALRDDLGTLAWMSPVTRRAALKKLGLVTVKIGYPAKWRDYSAYHVVRAPYLENVLQGRQFEFRRELAKIGKPVDRTEWEMTPQTVNAYYDPSMNEIVFPAGILQPPYFDSAADDALNYGAIGAVIGHEITHGFDDEGRKFDGYGNLKNWWTPEDLKRYERRARCVEQQFSSYVAIDNIHENGKLVLGESIADLGGVTLAYRAFEKTREFRSGKKIQGFTPQQRFFLAYAGVWASNIRPELIRVAVTVNPHPLARYRTNGPLSNLAPFARAFSCKAGAPMVRRASERCKIW